MLLPRLLIAGAALLAAVLLSSVAIRPAAAQIDLSGTWSVQFSGSVNLSCNPAYIKQHGTPLFIVLPCLPPGGVAGTIDKGTGNFTGSSTYLCKGFIEVTFTLNGTAAQDGNTISGTWNTLCLGALSGTFSGERVGPPVLTFEPPTLTPTPTDTPAPSVGGIVVDPDTDALQLQTDSSSSSEAWLLTTGLAIATAGALVLGGATWYVRRRRMR